MNIWWKLGLIITAITIFAGLCYHKGAASVQDKWDLANAEATTKARKIESDNAILSNVMGEKYEIGIKAIDDNFNTALARLQQSAGSDMPGKAKASCKPDAAPGNNKLYRENKQARLELARQADLQAQRLISLQEWERAVK